MQTGTVFFATGKYLRSIPLLVTARIDPLGISVVAEEVIADGEIRFCVSSSSGDFMSADDAQGISPLDQNSVLDMDGVPPPRQIPRSPRRTDSGASLQIVRRR